MLGRHAEARHAYVTGMNVLGLHPSLSPAEAETLQLEGTREEDKVQSGIQGSGSRWGGMPWRVPTLALALAAHGNSPRMAEMRRRLAVTPVLRHTGRAPHVASSWSAVVAGRGGDNSDGARFRYVSVYAPPNCGSSSLIAELKRLFGSTWLAQPEWLVWVPPHRSAHSTAAAHRLAG